jgi:MFS family permease
VGLVPVLVSLTDRLDPRRIYLASMALTVAAMFGFALLAGGFWSALIFRVAAGIGLAGTYMPGLKILSDRFEGAPQARAIAFYTASFSIGASLSYLLAGEIAAALDWRWAFGAGALGAAAAGALVFATIAPAPPLARPEVETHLLDFRPVLANRRALAYILAYAAHNWELFGMRSWIVAFLAFSLTLQPGPGGGWNITLIASLVVLMGWPASVLGNELASRFGRPRVVAAIMIVSALVAVTVGFSAGLPFPLVIALCFVFGITVTGESGSVTAGAVAEAAHGQRGATMAVHSCIGFAGAFVGPLAVGVVLDLAGGGASLLAWGLAFVTMGAGVALGPLALLLLRR